MLTKGGGRTYHLCFETSDMEAALAHAKDNRALDEKVERGSFYGERYVDPILCGASSWRSVEGCSVNERKSGRSGEDWLRSRLQAARV